MGKIIQLHRKDPWANITIPFPGPDAGREQLFEFAILTSLNSLAGVTPDDKPTKVILRRTTVAYLEAWHLDLKAPPL